MIKRVKGEKDMGKRMLQSDSRVIKLLARSWKQKSKRATDHGKREREK